MQQTEVLTKDVQLAASTPEPSAQDVALSIVVPVMNEQQSVRPLYEKLSAQLDELGQHYEVIFVDDGSTDNTFKELKALHDEHPGSVRVTRFRRNFGKTPAL